jgi:hypothetical protein
MRLATASRVELEEFYREALAQSGLALTDIRFHSGAGARFFVRMIRVSGITLGRHIFLVSSLDEQKRRVISGTLAVHEVCHVLQYERKGMTRFLIDYVTEYFRILRRGKRWNAQARQQAYRSLSDEVEAQTAENQFIQWRLNRRHNLPANWPLDTANSGKFKSMN